MIQPQASFPDDRNLVREVEQLSTALLQERCLTENLKYQNGALRVAVIRMIQEAQTGRISEDAIAQLKNSLLILGDRR